MRYSVQYSIAVGLVFLMTSGVVAWGSAGRSENGALIGEWAGSMTLGPKDYPITIWFDDGQPVTGRIQLVGLTTDNNPLTDISLSQGTITFALASLPPQRFSGALQDDAIIGTIEIGSMIETFSIQKIAP